MPGDRDKTNLLRCSFCGKSQEEVKKLVAGPTVYICNECVALCNDILREEEKPRNPSRVSQAPFDHSASGRNKGCPGSVRDRPGKG